MIGNSVDPLVQIQNRIQPLRASLLAHPVYREIDRLHALQQFMEFHVFAV